MALDDRSAGLLFSDRAPGEIQYVPGAGVFDHCCFLLIGRYGLLSLFGGALFKEAGQDRSTGYCLTRRDNQLKKTI
jgi:hypothetical protein